ncbi:MAG TPA: Na+/H+ antiporter subunit E [Casimicrobiaceae bacterium]|nr:Na+/H+ antiporter subunit E [Casimicrobiaceae bacterium]
MSSGLALLWLGLVGLWLLLNDALSLADVIVGALVGIGGVLGFARLQPTATRLRRPWAAGTLLVAVLVDIVRSNVAVAAIVLRPGSRRGAAGFVDIPLDIRHPAALAALACIITSTPGTAWAGYDSRANVLTMHVLDLVDEATWKHTIKERYERRLMEIFQ